MMKKNDYNIIKRIFQFVFQNIGIYAILAPFYYFIEGIFPAIITYINAKFFDDVYLYLNDEIDSVKLWNYVIVILMLYIFRVILTFISSVAINVGVYEKLSCVLKLQLTKKTMKLKMIDLEDTAIYNKCTQAKECIKKEYISATYMISIVLISYIVSVIASSIVLASYSYYIIPICFICALPYYISFKLLGSQYYELKNEQVPMKRKTIYLWEILTKPSSVKELRITNSLKYINEKWNILNKSMQDQLLIYKLHEIKNTFICTMIKMGGLVISIGIILILVYKSKISIGEFGACILAFSELQNRLKDFFSETGKYNEKLKFASDYFLFLDLPEETIKVTTSVIDIDSISLKNISFKYPSMPMNALNHINLSITKGESIAIVGENGCGKTTLTKLLTGIFSPDSGEIMYNNVNYESINKDDIRSKISIISQDFNRYYLSLRENIAISDISQMNNNDKIRECLYNAGLKSLQCGIDDQIGNLFGGHELSGGQWQRIAIARLLFRDASLYIMDEPTSALDPVTEADILKEFLEILKNKTCIIVSHRIGLCKYVDKIVVMKKGEIVEIGNHKELYDMKGEYWKIYNYQSQWYKK